MKETLYWTCALPAATLAALLMLKLMQAAI